MAAWFTDPAGTRQLVLAVYGGSDFNGEYDCVAIPMTREYATRLLERIARVNTWNATDADLSVVKFYDDERREYYALDARADDDDGPPWWARDDGDGRTECDRLVITHIGDVYWTAVIKHSDPPADIESESLTAADLRAYVDGDDPWAGADDEHDLADAMADLENDIRREDGE